MAEKVAKAGVRKEVLEYLAKKRSDKADESKV